MTTADNEVVDVAPVTDDDDEEEEVVFLTDVCEVAAPAGSELERQIKKRRRVSVASRWTPAEEVTLRALISELGRNGRLSAQAWDVVTQRLGGSRSTSSIQQHWTIMCKGTKGERSASASGTGGLSDSAEVGTEVLTVIGGTGEGALAMPVAAHPTEPHAAAATATATATATVAQPVVEGAPFQSAAELPMATAQLIGQPPPLGGGAAACGVPSGGGMYAAVGSRFGLSSAEQRTTLPPGWSAVRHEAPAGPYFVYHGPRGQRVRSKTQAWRQHSQDLGGEPTGYVGPGGVGCSSSLLPSSLSGGGGGGVVQDLDDEDDEPGGGEAPNAGGAPPMTAEESHAAAVQTAMAAAMARSAADTPLTASVSAVGVTSVDAIAVSADAVAAAKAAAASLASTVGSGSLTLPAHLRAPAANVGAPAAPSTIPAAAAAAAAGSNASPARQMRPPGAPAPVPNMCTAGLPPPPPGWGVPHVNAKSAAVASSQGGGVSAASGGGPTHSSAAAIARVAAGFFDGSASQQHQARAPPPPPPAAAARAPQAAHAPQASSVSLPTSVPAAVPGGVGYEAAVASVGAPADADEEVGLVAGGKRARRGVAIRRWTPEEEDRLRSTTTEVLRVLKGSQAWAEIAVRMGGERSGEALHQHYQIMEGRRRGRLGGGGASMPAAALAPPDVLQRLAGAMGGVGGMGVGGMGVGVGGMGVGGVGGPLVGGATAGGAAAGGLTPWGAVSGPAAAAMQPPMVPPMVPSQQLANGQGGAPPASLDMGSGLLIEDID